MRGLAFADDANGGEALIWIHDVCVTLIVNYVQRLDVDLGNDEEVGDLIELSTTIEDLGGDFKLIVELVDLLEGWKSCDRCFFEEFHNVVCCH